MDEEDLRIDASWHSDISEGALKDAAAVKAFDKTISDNEKNIKKNDAEMRALNVSLEKNKKALKSGSISAQDYAKNLTRISERTHELSVASAGFHKAIARGRRELRGFRDETDRNYRTLTRVGRLLGGGGGGGIIGRSIRKITGLLGRMAFGLGKVARIMKRGFIPALIIIGGPFILRGIAALSGGIFALASRWSQATGILLAAPAALATVGGALGVMMLAVKGAEKELAKLFSTFGKGLTKTAGKAVFSPKTLASIRLMLKEMKPLLNKGVKGIGNVWGGIIQGITKELSRKRSKNLLSDILGTKKNSKDGVIQQLKTLGTAAAPALNLLLRLVKAGQPVMKMMADDISRFFKNFKMDDDKTLGFINRSYDVLKEFGRTSANFIRGIVNIGKIAKGYGSLMTKSLEDISKKFLDWTTSGKGQQSIAMFFADLRPVLKELGQWIPALSAGLKTLTQSNSDFVTTSMFLRTKALPAIVTVWNAMEDKLVPIASAVWDSLKAIGDSGIGQGAVWAIQKSSEAVVAVIKAISSLPGGAAILGVAGALIGFRIAMGFASTMIGGKAIAGAASAAGLMGSAKSNVATMQVGVINAGVINGGVGGAGAVGAAGKGGKAAKAGAGVASKAGVAAAAGAAAAAAGKSGVMSKVGAVAGRIVGPIGAALVGLAVYNSTKSGQMPGLMDTAMNAATGALAGGAVAGPWGALAGGLIGGLAPIIGSLIGKNANQNSPEKVARNKAAVDSYSGVLGEVQAKNKARVNQQRIDAITNASDPNYGKYFLDSGEARTRPLTRQEWKSLKDLEKETTSKITKLTKFNRTAQFGTRAQREADMLNKGYDPKSPTAVSAWKQSDRGRGTFRTGLLGTGTADQRERNANKIVSVKLDIKKANAEFKAFKARIDLATSRPSVVDVQLRIAGATLLEYVARNAPSPQTPSVITPNPGMPGFGDYNPYSESESVTKNFTGGNTYGGLHLVGEKGPEQWLGKSGQSRLLGAYGPEILRLGPGAVINAEATRDPFTTKPGLTPQWALDTLQANVQNKYQYAPAVGNSGARSGPQEVHVQFGDLHPASGIDLENSIRRGMLKASRDRAERS